MTDRITDDLRKSYDNQALRRDESNMADWKQEARDGFVALLKKEKKHTVLEIGSGPGRDGLFLKENGFDVTCTDLSSENVRLCWEKGLKAQEMDARCLVFPEESFDAVYALNSLLHIPKAEFPGVLESIKSVLKPDGLFYMGVYGGAEFEGIRENDWASPPRFFNFYSDDNLSRVVSAFFTIVSSANVQVDPDDHYHFQSLVLRKTSS